MKEIKLSPNITQHDIGYRVIQANKFLEKGEQVKVTLLFKGREKLHEDIGWKTIGNFVSLCINGIQAGTFKVVNGRRKSIIVTINPKGKKNGKSKSSGDK